MSLCKDGCVFQAGFIFTSNTDVSAFVQDFIKSQPAVYPGRRLPRLIFLQYIPFCSILGTKKTPGGHIVQVPYIKLIQWNYHCICLTQTEPPAAQRVSALSWEPSRGTSPLVSKSWPFSVPLQPQRLPQLLGLGRAEGKGAFGSVECYVLLNHVGNGGSRASWWGPMWVPGLCILGRPLTPLHRGSNPASEDVRINWDAACN